MSKTVDDARAFLGGASFLFETVNDLWPRLKKESETSLARLVLARLRSGEGLLDELPPSRKTRAKLCQQQAELTSKDPELSASTRHDTALKILGEMFDLDDPSLDGDLRI